MIFRYTIYIPVPSPVVDREASVSNWWKLTASKTLGGAWGTQKNERKDCGNQMGRGYQEKMTHRVKEAGSTEAKGDWSNHHTGRIGLLQAPCIHAVVLWFGVFVGL